MHTLKRSMLAGLFLLLLISAFVVTATPVSAVGVGNHEVNFITVRYDYPATGQSTWYYTVTGGSQPGLSHVVFELNLDCLNVVDEGTWDGTDLNSLTPGGGDPEIMDTEDPTTGIIGLKFDDGFNDNETRHYYFTVNGNYAEDSITVAAKGGNGDGDTAQITGPSLDCEESVPKGSLKVKKKVYWNGSTPIDGQTFEICITGPSYQTPNCKNVENINGDGGDYKYAYVTWNDLIPGEYTVTETDPGGEWDVTVPDGPVTVASGQTAEADVENEYILGSLKVTKSVNWNGVAEDTGKTFEICITGPTYPQQANCQNVGANGGDVTWNDLIPGEYTVSETNPGSEWTVTVPDGPVTVASGQTAEANVSNVYKPASLGDYVWEDTNQNGIQDGGESPVPNVRVDLLNVCGGPSIADTLTDANGLYLFSNLQPGDYVVKFMLPAGYLFTTADAGENGEIDSDANGTTGCTPEITLEAGENDMTWDAGIYIPAEEPNLASLGDYVWHDVNENGIQEEGENPVPNVTIDLLTVCDGTPIASMETDGDGKYLFSNLEPGTYVVKFTLPDGYVFTEPNLGGNDEVDSDADKISGCTGPITLEAGENDMTWDAGIYVPAEEPPVEEPELASLGDYVWHDVNRDGIQQDGESGISGVTVELVSVCDGTPIASTTTDGNGLYLFSNLQPGDYVVRFTLLDGYVFTAVNQGGNAGADSDANTDTGCTPTINLEAGENDMTWDVGIYTPVEEPELASLGNYVWYDEDEDGIQDGEESGVEGVRVELVDACEDVEPLAFQLTDSEGAYLFEDLEPGTYVIRFTLPDAPDDADVYEFTLVNVTDDESDSDADPETGCTGEITLVAGQDDMMWDAGIYQTTAPTGLPGGEQPQQQQQSIFLPAVQS